MKRAFILSLICALLAFAPAFTHAAGMQAIVGGQTTVQLDPTLLSGAGLTVSSYSPEVIIPGILMDSIALPINPPSAAIRPTTFTFDQATFPAPGSFSGEINHSGSVFFNSNTLQVGDITLAFDAARVGTLSGQASGFYAKSNAGITGILFDLTVPTVVTEPGGVKATADLLISPEFGQALVDMNVTNFNLRGFSVGVTRVQGNVPEPAAAGLALSAMALAGVIRRRR
jgi:MYXO-CTERM domain-containing protein